MKISVLLVSKFVNILKTEKKQMEQKKQKQNKQIVGLKSKVRELSKLNRIL